MAGRLIYDLSPPVHPGLAVWPGDEPFRRQVAMSFAGGDHLELSSAHGTVHLGAHADAPLHYSATGADIAARDLDLYYGPCQVIRVAVGRGERIRPEHLPGPLLAPRVLFHTGTYPDPDRFTEDFAALSPALIDTLAAAGVRLVGIDTPSVDLCHDKVLESHNALARHDMAVLEGLVLDQVPPGVGTLVALPLRLVGFDASPVRAILIRETE